MRSDGGFTFVEVLVSLGLLLGGILLFAHFSLFCLDRCARSRDASESLLLAQEQMELLAARGWEGAAVECLEEPAPAAPGEGAAGCVKEGNVRGRRYTLLLERVADGGGLEYFTVRCRRRDATAAAGPTVLHTARRCTP